MFFGFCKKPCNTRFKLWALWFACSFLQQHCPFTMFVKDEERAIRRLGWNNFLMQMHFCISVLFKTCISPLFISEFLYFCILRGEKKPLLKRPSDANAAQSHQVDPTFVTPPPPILYNTFALKFVILHLDLSEERISFFHKQLTVYRILQFSLFPPHFTIHLPSNVSSFTLFVWVENFISS